MRLSVCVVVSVALAGCALHGPQSGEALQQVGQAIASSDPNQSLETFMAKVRERAAEARPVRTSATTIEAHDPLLSAALAAATLQKSPEAYRSVAREYARLGISDRSGDYLQRALLLDRRDWATYDALARVERDSGALNIALANAHRAVYFAPGSPIAHNTLGTILQALGLRKQAREQYERALRLDPAATYALNNLCYGWILDGDASRAAYACQQALSLNPELTVARNNLGILHAARGDFESARSQFQHSGDEARVSYNLGIVYLARREYRRAASAFLEAQQVRPTRQTAARVRQALALSAAAGGDE